MNASLVLPILFLLFVCVSGFGQSALEKRVIHASDGLAVTVDYYAAKGRLHAPIIVLFHQANWSRGEYREIAPRLVSLGFHVLAVDQRSGGAVNGVTNETAAAARAAKLGVAFTDAIPDLVAALRAARTFTAGPVLAWGSSYSSSLVLKVVADEADSLSVHGVISFSPSEYFPDRALIQTAVRSLSVPVFLTSARSEAANYASIAAAIPSTTSVATFRPNTAGRHGSSALWAANADHGAYWAALEDFLAPWRSQDTSAGPLLVDSESQQLIVDAETHPWLLEGSSDLHAWSPLALVEEGIHAARLGPMGFYRVVVAEERPRADVVSVSATSTSVSVGIRSEETGCDQYADWWEILDEEGTLLYRRILAHSHVAEQPFSRSGSVNLSPGQRVWVRAHMNATGYGGQAFFGSIETGFAAREISPLFALRVADQLPLPDGCDF